MQANRITLSRRGLLIGTFVLATGPRLGAGAQTPAAPSLAPFIDRFGDLLGMVPPMPEDPDDPTRVVVTWVDLERQLGAIGVPRPSGDELPEGFGAGTTGLPMSHGAFVFARDPRWSETFGFDPLAVNRFLQVGEPGNAAAVFDGVDTQRVRAALIASGFTAVSETPPGAFLTFGDELKLDSPVSQLATGNMNQAVLLDGVAIFGPDRATIEQVPRVIAGEAPSLATQGGWLGIAGTLAEDVVGALAITPEAFAASGDPSAIREAIFAIREGANDQDIWDADDSGEPLPEPTTIAGLPANRARVQARIRYADAATATEQAAAIPERWASMPSSFGRLPYAQVMMVEHAGVDPTDPTVAAVDFRVRGPASRWRELVERGDLAPFLPET